MVKKNNSDTGIFSIATFIYKDSNKKGTFSRYSLFHYELKLLQALLYSIKLYLIEYTIIKSNLLKKNAHARYQLI